MQEALARQRAQSAVSGSQTPADPIPRSGSPWDSAWDQQSAAARRLSADPSRQPDRQRQTNLAAFGSIVGDYRPAAQPPIAHSSAAAVPRSHRYGHA